MMSWLETFGCGSKILTERPVEIWCAIFAFLRGEVVPVVMDPKPFSSQAILL